MRLDIDGNPHFWITFDPPISHFIAFPREMSEVTCKYYFVFICASQFGDPYLLQLPLFDSRYRYGLIAPKRGPAGV